MSVPGRHSAGPVGPAGPAAVTGPSVGRRVSLPASPAGSGVPADHAGFAVDAGSQYLYFGGTLVSIRMIEDMLDRELVAQLRPIARPHPRNALVRKRCYHHFERRGISH